MVNKINGKKELKTRNVVPSKRNKNFIYEIYKELI